jgi:hypothetical protein
MGTNRQPMCAAVVPARMRRDRRPLQNRVTPFGDVVAISQRGLYIGNRGIIHDPATKTLLGRRWTTKAWLVCVLDYKGRRRELMGGRSWTELFFLDEAVALAAGHRPCFFCRRADAQAFRAAWGTATGREAPLAPEIDAVLHEERLDRGRKRIHAIPDPVAELPDGAVIIAAGEAYTIAHGRAFLWSEQGYEAARQIRRADGLLTHRQRCSRSGLATGRCYTPILKKTPISDLGCGRFFKATLAGAGLNGRDESILAYSLKRDRIAKPDPHHSFGAAPTDGRRLNPVTLIEITPPAIAGSVTVSSSANAVFGICLSCRMEVELPCRDR